MLLHWSIAALLAFQIGLGWRMEELPRGAAQFWGFQLHKSIGITLLVLTLARIAVRLVARRPAPEADSGWAKALAGLVHFLLYAFMLGAPLSGWALVSTSTLRVPTLVFDVLPWPHLPGLEGLQGAAREAAHQGASNAHGLLVWIGIALFVLHVAGAIRHQILLGEPLVERMIPIRRQSISGSMLAIGGAIGFVALAYALAWLIPPPASSPAPAAVAVESPADPTADAPANVAEPAEANAVAPVEDDADNAIAAVEAEEEAAPAVLPRWAVQPGGRLGFTARWNGDPIAGRFANWTADIRFHEKALDRSTIKVTVDLASASTDDGQRDATIQSDAFFDTASHPQAVFTATGLRALGGDRYRADGRLSLRGVEKPVSLAFRLKIDGDAADVRGDATLTRTAFGVGQGEYASTAEIAGEVAVDFRFEAKQGN